MLDPEERQQVEEILARAQRRRALGPAVVDEHVVHAEAMAEVVGAAPRSCCDLGSGGGVPALILMLAWPDTHFTLIEAMSKRTRWLGQACRQLGVADRCRVIHARAEVIGRDPSYRGRFDVVTARAFGAPSVTAECAAPLLQESGWLIVSEPPNPDPRRWPSDGLVELGLGPAVRHEPTGAGAAFVTIEKVGPTPEKFPRRTGVPGKRALW